MSFAQAIVLGLVQGLTELLPVSSDGHLALVQKLLGWGDPQLSFTVALHLGTLAAVCLYFRHDLAALVVGVVRFVARPAASPEQAAEARRQAALAGLLVLATVPAGLAGVLLDDLIEASARSFAVVGGCLVANGAVLWLGEYLGRRRSGGEPVTLARALGIGLAQVSALLPGVSRSGTTISTGMALGVEPSEAARFSFLLSVPAVLGAGVWEGFRAARGNALSGQWGYYLLGAVVAALSGWLALHLVFRAVRRGKLRWFGVYCGVVGLAVLGACLIGRLPA